VGLTARTFVTLTELNEFQNASYDSRLVACWKPGDSCAQPASVSSGTSV
jgi:hypothetical protein